MINILRILRIWFFLEIVILKVILEKKDAVEFYEKALEICKSFYGEEHIEYGELLVKVGKNNGIAE